MSTWNKIRRFLYFTQRTMGDISAAKRGPQYLLKRLARRELTRNVWGRGMDRLFR